MPSYKAAHLHEQGQDMIIFPLERSFGNQTQSAQASQLDMLEDRANSAGLRGSAVVVWDNGGGRMGFMGPRAWHPFLRSINLQFVLSNLNQEISW